MRALVCSELGNPTLDGPDAPLSWTEHLGLPKVPPMHVRIRVIAAGLNFADALQVQGQYQVKPPLPFVPGAECSGVVVEIGSKVPAGSGLLVGDKVVAVTQGGAFAEEVCVHCAGVFKVPDGVDMEPAAGLPVAFGTSYLALVDRAGMRHQTKRPGQQGAPVLVLGAAGGVGLAAVQIAQHLGYDVIAVARGADKVAALQGMGVDLVLDSADLAKAGTPLHQAVKQVYKKGVQVVYDPVGGAAFTEALRCCAWGAQYLVIGFASGTIPKAPANILLVKNITMHGIYWGSYMLNNPSVLANGMRQLLQWLQERHIKVQVSHRFYMHQAPRAFKALLSREAIGKVLFLVPPQPTAGSSSNNSNMARPVARL